jgi:Tfp pilus assembly protein FimT
MRIRRRAYSLVEIVVVVSIMATILAVGIPSLSRYRANQQLHTTVDGIVQGINIARGMATQYADGQQLQNGTLPAVDLGEYSVFSVKQGSVNQTQVYGADSDDSVNIVWLGGGDNSNFARAGPHLPVHHPPLATLTGPTLSGTVGSVLAVGTTTGQFHIAFNQDGTLHQDSQTSNTLQFQVQNQYMTYLVTVNSQGAVTVQQQ